MRLEAHNAFGDVINSEVTRVVVYDDYDNPISVTFKYNDGNIFTANVTDPDFQRILSFLGIKKIVKVSTLKSTSIKDAIDNSRTILNQ